MVDRSSGLLYEDGQGYSKLDAQAHRDRLDGYAVVSGLGVTVSSGLTLSVASGEALVGETSGSVDTVTYGGGTVTLNAADSQFPRKDTIYIDSAGAIQAETGTPEEAFPEDEQGNKATRFNTVQPEPPFPSAEGTILAEVWVGAGVTALQSADVRDRRSPADVVGERGVFDSVSTEQVANRHYAGAYSGASEDARLDNAIAAAAPGSTIYLEAGVYSANRTVSDAYRFIGSGASGTTIDAIWTLNSSFIALENLTHGSNVEYVVDQPVVSITGSQFSQTYPVTVNAGRFRFVNNEGATVTFASGTSQGIVDSCTRTSVTDNGTNTVGDIA